MCTESWYYISVPGGTREPNANYTHAHTHAHFSNMVYVETNTPFDKLDNLQQTANTTETESAHTHLCAHRWQSHFRRHCENIQVWFPKIDRIHFKLNICIATSISTCTKLATIIQRAQKLCVELARTHIKFFVSRRHRFRRICKIPIAIKLRPLDIDKLSN